MSPPQEPGFETRAIHAGQNPDPSTGAVIPPVHLATTFAQRAVGEHRGYEYARSGNPSRTSLERQLASLEGAAHGFAFASGLAAEDAVLRAAMAPGDHLIVPQDAYGGTFRLIDQVHGPAGIGHSAAHLADTGSARRGVAAATPDSSGWRRRATHCSRSSTSPPLPMRRTSGVRSSWWTTPSPRPTCRTRWHWGPMS